MATGTEERNSRQTFEDLRGLRAEGYVRDSTLDQRDGFGPAIQRHNIERFAASNGLVLGGRWYVEFESGRSVARRDQFRQFLEDAQTNAFDVLLVDHTSRFGRNQEECIRFKGELRRGRGTVGSERAGRARHAIRPNRHGHGWVEVLDQALSS